MPSKICPRCDSSEAGFATKTSAADGLQTYCRACVKIANQGYRKANAERLSQVAKEKYKADPEKFRGRCRTYYDSDPEKGRERCRSWRKQTSGYQRVRSAVDIQYRLGRRLRTRLYHAVVNGFRSGSAVRDLGCTITELKLRLEQRFRPGMSWENYGQWHIDHIKPLARFDLTDRAQLLVACHYTNLQPLWAEQNIKKSNREGACVA